MAKQMRENPRFVETLARMALDHFYKNCKKKKIKGKIYIKAMSEDSIHLHNVFAETTKELK
jgi:GTP cyclohydrolase FolE2